MTLLGDSMEDEKRKQQRQVVLGNTKIWEADRRLNLAKRTRLNEM